MMKTIDVLRSVRGVYSVTFDVEKNMFKIRGEVDPSVLLKAVLSTGEHAELVTIRLSHPQLRRRNYNYGSYGPTNGYQLPYYTNGGYRSLANYPYHHETNGYYPYSMPHEPAPIAPYNYNYSYTTTNDHQYPPPLATYVPSYPPLEYDAYGNYDSINPCTIM
ncbi:hypothetical protein L1987_36282 [Smallanthus sonchifolius]|uniref:Uncharacterized protein n=1 Tax=Smallanthus sonchifolius TaxID=185202 RepID=A0ACB9HFJ8_9ASTR|nr:hypothetical protein L1987_36282 [Smallanthus sonchifolius]